MTHEGTPSTRGPEPGPGRRFSRRKFLDNSTKTLLALGASHVALQDRVCAQVVSKNHRVLINSWGGVRAKIFRAAVNNMSHEWREKDRKLPGAPTFATVDAFTAHLRKPPATIGEHYKLIYVVGDPLDAVLTFFKRSNYSNDQKQPTWKTRHLQNLGGNASDIKAEWDIKEFVDDFVPPSRPNPPLKKDPFGLQEQFDNWTKPQNNPHKTKIVRYETMWTRISEIQEYIGLEDRKYTRYDLFPLDTEPVCDHRHTDYDGVRDQLLELYKDLQAEVNALPPISDVN